MGDPYVLVRPKKVAPTDLFQFAVDRERDFHPTLLIHSEDEKSERVVNLNIRRSLSLISSDVDKLIDKVCREVLGSDADITRRLGLPRIRWPHTTGSCIAYNDQDFVGAHDDTVRSVFGERRIGCLYYFYREPKQFSGGEFILYCDGKKHVIEPESGTMVLFPVTLRHEVYPISVPSKRFEDGRFVLAGFIWEAGSLMRCTEVSIRKSLGSYSSYPPLSTAKKLLRRIRARDYRSDI